MKKATFIKILNTCYFLIDTIKEGTGQRKWLSIEKYACIVYKLLKKTSAS